MDLLECAVQALEAGRTPELGPLFDHGAEIDLGLPALLPDDYLPDVDAHLVTYKPIASAKSPADLEDLEVQMIARFGLLPDPAENLVAITAFELEVQPLGTRKPEAGPRGGRIVFGEQPNIDHMKLIQLLQSRPTDYKPDQAAGALRSNMDIADPAKRIAQEGNGGEEVGAVRTTASGSVEPGRQLLAALQEPRLGPCKALGLRCRENPTPMSAT